MKTSNLVGFVAAGLLALALLSCGKGKNDPVVRQTTAMNTYVSISVYDPLPKDQVKGMVDSAVGEIQRIENMATDYSDSSEIGHINLASGLHPVKATTELIKLIRMSLAYGDSTGGMFDVTIGPLVKTWDLLSAHPKVPAPDTIRALLKLIDYHTVVIRGDSVYLPKRGMALDLGSLGKGYAIQQACNILAKGGAKRFIVDIGGKLGILWEGASGLDTNGIAVYVKHPRVEGSYLGQFKYGTGSVATSGDYQRYFIIDGKRYHHLLDPRTGYPMGGLISVTVVTQDATEADALSTIVFLLGREKGMEYIKKTPGLEGILVSSVGDSLQIDLSPGFEGKFHPEK